MQLRLRRLSPVEMVFLAITSVLLAASGYLLWSYREVLAEQSALEVQVVRREAEARRAQDAQQAVEKLREELAQLQAQLALPPEVSFPKTVPGVEATQLVITALRNSGLELSNLTFAGETTARMGTRDYRAYRFTTRARGPLSQMSGFLKGVEEGGFATLVLRNIVVTPGPDGAVWDLGAEAIIYAQP